MSEQATQHSVTHAATRSTPVSAKMVWSGRIISAIPALILLLSATAKLMKAPQVVQGFAQYGVPGSLIIIIGVIELACVIIYLVPRTAVLGAILMTALFGGATMTNVRVGDLQYIGPVVLGVLVWAGLFFRDERVRALIPLRKLN